MTEFKKRTQKTRLFCSVAHFSVKSNGDPNYNSESTNREMSHFRSYFLWLLKTELVIIDLSLKYS